jgi:hypothetical protein
MSKNLRETIYFLKKKEAKNRLISEEIYKEK